MACNSARSSKFRRHLASSLVAIASVLVPALVTADEQYGHKFYLRYCSACHGETAKGDGVVAHLMKPAPNDLTQLAKKAGGKFPFYEVIRVIDGRETVRAHGDSNMPVWGDIFKAEEGAAPDAHAVARGKVVLIADYLESVQAK